jgi:hypothetical protein
MPDMPEPKPDDAHEGTMREFRRLIEQSQSLFQSVPLTDEEKAFAKGAAEKLGHHALLLVLDDYEQRERRWHEEMRAGNHGPGPKRYRMLALSVAIASTLAIIDAHARVADEFVPPRS